MKTGRDIIENCCGQIMSALKTETFTQEDLEFLIKFFRRLAEISEGKLNKNVQR